MQAGVSWRLRAGGTAGRGWVGLTYLAIVGADVGRVIEVQGRLPAEPPAVQAGVPVPRCVVEVLMRPQGSHQLACKGSPTLQPALPLKASPHSPASPSVGTAHPWAQGGPGLVPFRHSEELTFPFDEKEGKFLHLLWVHDAHLPTHLLQHLCYHLGTGTGP